MKRNVKNVRKSIENRKKNRTQLHRSNQPSQFNSYLPQNEEKHGYLPLVTGEQSKSKSKNKQPFKVSMLLKGILAVMLFLGTALVMDTQNARLSAPKQFLNTALSQEFPFAKVNQWYHETFGAPLAFEPGNDEAQQDDALALPAAGQVVETFQTNGSGVMLASETPTSVNALKSGIVIFAGNDRKTGKTVVVQHADDSVSTYGQLSDIDVHAYQSVAANEQMGKFKPEDDEQTFYFSVKENNEAIDPMRVIQVDDRP